MRAYVLLVGIVSFAVDFMLLLGTNRLLGAMSSLRRIGFGALLGAVHAMLCVFSGFRLFAGLYWNIILLFLRGLVAYGFQKHSIGKCLLYILLSMSLSWLTAGTGGNLWMALLGSAGILFLCIALVTQSKKGQELLPVELTYQEEKVCIWALRDTGNELRDPISGNPVLVVGPKVAERLLGLTQRQLENPVEAVGYLPGLRLIPFHTVGKNNGLLLGMRIQNTKIGKWRGSTVVAFAPCGLGERQNYQALTGGNL